MSFSTFWVVLPRFCFADNSTSVPAENYIRG